MTNKHTYTVNADYVGGLDGVGRVRALGFESLFSAPKDLRGSGEGTNPEELLAAAASACYLITLGAILKFQGVEAKRFLIRTEVDVDVALPMKVTHVRHYPTIVLANSADPGVRAKVEAAIARAEAGCLVGQALKPAVVISVAATIEELK